MYHTCICKCITIMLSIFVWHKKVPNFAVQKLYSVSVKCFPSNIFIFIFHISKTKKVHLKKSSADLLTLYCLVILWPEVLVS